MFTQLSAADLRALSIFQTICRCGGFTGAQDALDLSQSTISNHIAGLESRIGFSLCTRGRKGYQLTERGKSVLDTYQKLSINLDSFCHDISALQDESSGVLRVGTLDHMLTENRFSVVQLISDFTHQSPNVELHLIQDNQFELHNALVEEQLDLVIGAAVNNSKFVKTTRLYDELHHLYCGKNHPFFAKGRDQLSTHDIAAANWVTNGYPPGVFSMQPFPNVKSSVIATNIETIAMTILAGKHIGYLPAHYAGKYENQSLLKQLLPSEFSQETEISVISKVGRRQSYAMRQFQRVCLEQVHVSSGSLGDLPT